MLSNFLRITGATALIVLCTLMPFLPGRYDSLAVPLSLMCQVFGMLGLLLVPVGAIWMASGYSSRFAGKQFVFAIVALIGSSVLWVFISLVALVSSGLSFGLAFLALGAYVAYRVLPRLRRMKSTPPQRTSAVAYYLLLVPITVAILQIALVPPAIEFSRSRAIRNSAQLITDIEKYRAAHGRYPPSLLSEWEDYFSGVIGIKEYHYEPSGDAYNLFFEQFALHFGTREFVMYNPPDQQAMTAHKMDRLELTPEQLTPQQGRGHYAVHDAPHPQWKILWLD